MRLILTLSSLLTFSFVLPGQQYFPIKVDSKWGLMNADGQIIRQPVYDAIGEFKKFGYAVMQRDGKVGMLGNSGTEVILPEYEDIKVLDSTIIAVMEKDSWRVINLQGETLLPQGYERVKVWEGGFLAFMKAGKWGVIDYQGKTICRPHYQEIQPYQSGYFLTIERDLKGLLSDKGEEIIRPECTDFRIYNADLFFYKKGDLWGAVNRKGEELLALDYEFYQPVSSQFIRCFKQNRSFLFSVEAGRIISREAFDGFYPFSDQYILCKKNRRLGLMNTSGDLVLKTLYDEIQFFAKDQFRVKINDNWGVVSLSDEQIIPFEYDYIAPLKNKNCLLKKGRLFGIANYQGKIIAPVAFHNIALEEEQAKAWKGEALSIFYLDEEGLSKEESNFKKFRTITIGKQRRVGRARFSNNIPQNDYILDNFEWFYSSEDDKWGLRRLDDGTEQIEPSFDVIQVERNYGFTIVGIEQFNYYQFERTTYRFEMLYGMVNNDVGLLVTEVNMWDIRLSDFAAGHSSARVVFNNGRHGLVSRNPVGLFLKKDYAFIGDFYNGVARMSIKGRLSGSFKNKEQGLGSLRSYLDGIRSNNYMIDYTVYDREFESTADIVCEGCTWGYLDTAGTVVVQPQFNFARDFVNDVGIVQFGKKWGMVDANDMVLIPFEYDGIYFLENTDNKILRVFKNDQKYGLIDSLGQVAVNLQYDKIGAFREHRLAVQRNGLWGFVDQNGLEVIPCRFKQVKQFYNKRATVKLGNKWGIIDQLGNVVLDFEYTRLGSYKDDMAWVYTSKGVGYIDLEGNFVIEPQFNKAFDFENGIARVAINGKFGLIDVKGNYIIRPQYSFIEAFDENGLAKVRVGNSRIRYKLINKKGKTITNRAYKKIGEFSEGLAAVKYKDHYGFISTDGTLVIPAIYSKVADFKEGRAVVQKNGLCGYIDPLGKEVIALEFSKCLDFEEGKAVVYKSLRKGGLIDRDGNFIIEPSIHRLYDFSDGRGLVRDANYQFYYITQQARMYDGYYQKASEFQHGIAVVQSNANGQWGIINQKGIEIIPPKYDKIEAFEDGYARVRIKRFNGLTNLQGEMIVQPDYEYISYAGQGLFRVEQGDKIGYFDAEGTWIWGLSE